MENKKRRYYQEQKLRELLNSMAQMEPEKRLFLARHYIKGKKKRVDAEIAEELGVTLRDYRKQRIAIEKEFHVLIMENKKE